MRYAAIALAVSVVAGSATAAVALPRDATVKGTVAAAAFLADRDRPRIPSYCLYPPQSSPALGFTVNDRRVERGDRVRLTAVVTVNSCEIKGMPVALYKMASNETQFTLIAAGETDKNGEIKFKSDKLRRTTQFYVVTPGGSGFQSQQSQTITVTVRS
jgi:hypothetical protein